jgi:hypothetical protein
MKIFIIGFETNDNEYTLSCVYSNRNVGQCFYYSEDHCTMNWMLITSQYSADTVLQDLNTKF